MEVLILFDDRAIRAWLSEREARQLNCFGRQVVTIDRRSIRRATQAYARRNKRSGNPPRFHKRGQCTLKDGIFHAFRTRGGKGEVIAGAALCRRGRAGRSRLRGTVPQEVEFGSKQNDAFPHTGPALRQAIRRGLLKKCIETH